MGLPRYDLTVTDKHGDILVGASVEIRRETPGQPLAVIYSDRDGSTPITNPVTTDADGEAGFFVPDGFYKITVTAGSFSKTRRYVGIGLATEHGLVTVDGAQTVINKTIDTAANTIKLDGVSYETAEDLAALLPAFVGDTGSGGTKGLVPAPAAGDAAAGKFLMADGTFATATLTNLIRPEDYGAKGDGVVKASGGAIASGTNSFTSSGYSYVAADIGKTIAIDGAGAAGACLVTTISNVAAGAAILATNASTTVTTAAHEWGTDDSAALHTVAADSAGKAVWFGPGKTYFYKDTSGRPNIMLYATGPFKICGNGACVKALANANNQTGGFIFADSSWVGNGPTDFSVSDLTYDGNRTRRISSGAISNAVGDAAGFYIIGAQYFDLRNLRTRDVTADGLYIGGDTRTGRLSQFWAVTGGAFETAGRNGISVVGASYGSFAGVKSQNHSFGAAHSNISYGFDFEPDGSWNQNANIDCNSCTASSCQTGFGSNITLGSNTSITWGQCRAEACTAGFYESAAGSTKVFAARVSGNTTNFTNLTEKISGF